MEMFVPLIYCITDHALLQATHQTASAAAASVRQQHEHSPSRAATAFLLKFCSQPGSDLD